MKEQKSSDSLFAIMCKSRITNPSNPNCYPKGIKAAWTIKPYTRSIFVTTLEGEKIYYNQKVESAGIKVDFKEIFEI